MPEERKNQTGETGRHYRRRSLVTTAKLPSETVWQGSFSCPGMMTASAGPEECSHHGASQHLWSTALEREIILTVSRMQFSSNPTSLLKCSTFKDVGISVCLNLVIKLKFKAMRGGQKWVLITFQILSNLFLYLWNIYFLKGMM